MFFAETLGPVLTPNIGAALYNHIQQKLGGRTSVTVEELRTVVAAYLIHRGNPTTPEAAIQYLANHGNIATQDKRTYAMRAN